MSHMGGRVPTLLTVKKKKKKHLLNCIDGHQMIARKRNQTLHTLWRSDFQGVSHALDSACPINDLRVRGLSERIHPTSMVSGSQSLSTRIARIGH